MAKTRYKNPEICARQSRRRNRCGTVCLVCRTSLSFNRTLQQAAERRSLMLACNVWRRKPMRPMRRRAEPFDSRAAKCARSRCTPSDAHVCATAARYVEGPIFDVSAGCSRPRVSRWIKIRFLKPDASADHNFKGCTTGCQDVEKKSREASSKPDCSSLYCICFEAFVSSARNAASSKSALETFAARVHF